MARLPRIEEPKYQGVMTNIQVINALNWYHSNKENKDAQKYIQDYCKKNKIAGRLDTSKSYLTIGWLCRLVSNGNDVGEYVKHIKTGINRIMVFEEPVAVIDTPSVNVISIQDRMREKVGEIAGDIEGAIDDYILSDYKNIASPFAIMQERAKGLHAARIIDIFRKKRIEFDTVLNTDDKELRDAYSNFTKPQLKKIISYCDQIITDAMKIAGEAKVNRKPRKRKQKTPEQLVAKMSYLAKSDEYKIQSIPAKQIIGATQLWVFNVKTRKLGVYNAEDAGGFTVKGSKVYNFNEAKSICKTVRKPEEVLPNVLKGGKIALRNILSNLTTKESSLTGSINRDTILLRAI